MSLLFFWSWSGTNLRSWSPGTPSFKETSGLSFHCNETHQRQSHCISAFLMSVLVATSRLVSACSPRRGYSCWLLLGHVVFRSCIPESGICWIPEHRFSDCEMWAELLLGTMVIFSDQSLKPRPLAWQAGFLNRWLPREALHFVFYTPLFLVAPKEEAMSSSLRCPPPDPFLRHLLLLFPFTLE